MKLIRVNESPPATGIFRRAASEYSPFPRRSSLLVLACCAVLLGGCQTGRQADPLRERFPETSTTTAELDAQLRELIYRMERAAQRTASFAYLDATTSEERIAAAIFALRLAGEVDRAAFAGYPFATLADIWTLNVQLERHFEKTPEALGGRGLELARGFAAFASECEKLATQAAGSEFTGALATRIDVWADENPLTEELIRPSVARLLANLGVERRRGLGDISETVSEGLVRVGEKIERIQTELPMILSWQVAVLAEARLAGIEHDLSGVMETVSASLDPLVAAKVQDVLAAVREERIAIMQDVRNERMAIMAGRLQVSFSS